MKVMFMFMSISRDDRIEFGTCQV